MKKNIPSVINYRDTQRITTLKEKYANVINLADPIDKMMMLKELSGEIDSACTHEMILCRPSELVEPAYWLGGIFGGLGAGVGVAVLLSSMPVLAVASGVAVIVGVMSGGVYMGSTANDRAVARHQRKYADMGEYTKMGVAADKELRKLQGEIDPKDIALSPRAREVFRTFPSLKEEFMLSHSIDKARVADAEQKALPSLDKVKPEL